MSGRYLPVVALMSGLLSTLIAAATNSADRQVAVPEADQRLKLAREAMRAIEVLQKAPERVTSEQIYRWSHRLMQAELSVSGNEAERTAAIEKHLQRMKTLEKRAEEGHQHGETGYFDLLEARWRRIEAEALLSNSKTG